MDVGEPGPAEPVIRRLIDLCPDDAWARRELALHLANHGRSAEALAELDAAPRARAGQSFVLLHARPRSQPG